MASRMIASVGHWIKRNASPIGVVYNKQPDQLRQHDDQSVLQAEQKKIGKKARCKRVLVCSHGAYT